MIHGLGKPRSSFGKWLDRQGISQAELIRTSGLGKGTINRICINNEQRPSERTLALLRMAFDEMDVPFDPSHFW